MFILRVFEIAMRSDWKLSDELLDAVVGPWHAFGGSSQIELGVRELRQMESLKSGWNKKASNKRKWHTLIASSVLHDNHKHDSVDWQSEVLPKGSSNLSMDSFFNTRARDCTPWLKDIVGTSCRTAWYSPRPLHMIQQTLDLEMGFHFSEVGSPERSSKCWLSSLCSVGMMLLRRKGSDQMFINLGDCVGMAVLAWPAKRIETIAGTAWTFNLDVKPADIQTLFVYIAKMISWLRL